MTRTRTAAGRDLRRLQWIYIPALLALMDWRLDGQRFGAAEDWLTWGTWLLLVLMAALLPWVPEARRRLGLHLGMAYLFVLVGAWQPGEFYARYCYRLGAVGLLAYATPWKTLRTPRCWLALLLAIAMPWPLVTWRVLSQISEPLQHLTATWSGTLLYYLTYDVRVDGIWIHLPTGAVEILYGCTPVPLLMALLQAGLILRGLAHWNGAQKSWPRTLTWIFGLAIGLTVLRVAGLATVVHQPAVFRYWHEEAGTQLVSMLAVVSLAIATGRRR